MPFTKAQQVIDNFYAIHDRMKPQLEKLFDKRPKTAFEVKQVEAFREASASAHYDPGSLDGTRPGFSIPQFSMLQNTTPIWTNPLFYMRPFQDTIIKYP